MTRAVLDVGSNSVLLLVARRQGRSWERVAETSEVTALGENTLKSGLLGDRGMEDTLKALARAYNIARELGASSIVAGATMAVRIAKNAREFLDRAEVQGTPLQVVSGDEEARLSFLAVAEDPAFKGHARLSVVDVGGQSTELVIGAKNQMIFSRSFSVGTLGLREAFFGARPADRDVVFRAIGDIDKTIGASFERIEPGVAVTVGATGTNLISIRERMQPFEPERTHGKTLSYEEISRAFGWMNAMTDRERAAVIGIEPGRERTLHIGALILERFLHALHVEECWVSSRGWRYAALDHLAPSRLTGGM